MENHSNAIAKTQASEITFTNYNPDSCIVYRMPPEVRLQIYRYCLESETENSDDVSKWPQIIRSLEPWKALQKECLAEFFSKSWVLLAGYVWDDRFASFCYRFPSDALSQIKNMDLVYLSLEYARQKRQWTIHIDLYDIFVNDPHSKIMKATNITNLRIRTFMKQIQSKRNFHDFLFNIRTNFRGLQTILIEVGDARSAKCNMSILRGFVDMEFNYTFGNEKSDAEHYEDIYGAFICEINETLGCKGKLLAVSVLNGNETAEKWLWEDEKWKIEKPKFISRYFAKIQRRRMGSREIALLGTEQ